jgi:DNA-binding transcriptional MerR regulator
MTKTRKNEQTYSPAEICRFFGLSRTTLFRWEDTGEIRAAERNGKNQRVYRTDHLRSIVEHLRKKIREAYDNYTVEADRNDLQDETSSEELGLEAQERLFRLEVMSDALGKENRFDGLKQLRGLLTRRPFSAETVEFLTEHARNKPVGDLERQEIWKLLAENDEAVQTQVRKKTLAARG